MLSPIIWIVTESLLLALPLFTLRSLALLEERDLSLLALSLFSHWRLGSLSCE